MNMKKKWYDYLWILSLAYLALGFFNIMAAWLGLLCFFIPLIISMVSGTKGYWQPVLRQRAAFWPPGRTLRSFPEKGYPRLDEEPVVPVRLPGLFPCDVHADAF